jgi:biopolymer transport protein ExbD
MTFTPHKRRRAPSVIIVSLIDVLLVVLIFLMVSTTFKNTNPALKLSLPDSKQAKAGPTEVKPFMVIISSNAPYLYFDNQPVTMDRLQKELADATRKDPQLKMSIKADKHAPFGEVIRVIDAAKAANVAGISAITEKHAASPK